MRNNILEAQAYVAPSDEKSGADPGFLKRLVHLRSTSQNKAGVQEGLQLWAQC